MQKYNFNKSKFAIYLKFMQYVNHYGYKIKYMSEYDIDGWSIACRIMIVIMILLGVIFNYVMSG